MYATLGRQYHERSCQEGQVLTRSHNIAQIKSLVKGSKRINSMMIILAQVYIVLARELSFANMQETLDKDYVHTINSGKRK